MKNTIMWSEVKTHSFGQELKTNSNGKANLKRKINTSERL